MSLILKSNAAIANNPFNDISHSPIIDAALLEMLAWSMLAAAIIAAVLGLIKIGKVYYDDEIDNLANKDTAQQKKFKELPRLVFIALLIVAYPVWITPLVGFMTLVNSITTVEAETILEDRQRMHAIVDVIETGGSEANWIDHVLENHDKFSKSTVEFAQREKARMEEYNQNVSEVEGLMNQPTAPGDATNLHNPAEEYLNNKAASSSTVTQNNNDSNTSNSILMGIADFFGNIGELFLGGFFRALAELIRMLVVIFTEFLFKILIIIGPLALGTSMYWEDNAAHWFKIFINTGMVLTTINLLDGILSGFTYVFFSYSTGMYQGDSIGFAIFICGAYLSVFKITSWWVGKADAGKVASKSIAVGAAGVGAALGAVVMAKSGLLAGGSSSLQSMAKTLADSANSSRKKIQDE